jgi:competence protein ComEA
MSRALFATIVALFLVTASDVVSGQKAAGKAAAAVPAVVNLNTATATQIATLPGIGEKAAQHIIEYREKNGGFKKIEELMNVKGIGEKSFLKLKPLITVAPPKTEKPGGAR